MLFTVLAVSLSAVFMYIPHQVIKNSLRQMALDAMSVATTCYSFVHDVFKIHHKDGIYSIYAVYNGDSINLTEGLFSLSDYHDVDVNTLAPENYNIEVRYVINGKKYRIVFVDKIKWPIYSDERTSIRRVVSATLGTSEEDSLNENVTNQVKKYMGPHNNFYLDVDHVSFPHTFFPERDFDDDVDNPIFLRIIDSCGKTSVYNLSERNQLKWNENFTLDL